jgi:hypothetical protein
MAFKYNPATGKFEVQTSGGNGQAPSPATAKTPTTNISKAKQSRPANPQAVGPQPPAQPPRAAAGPPSPVTGQYPQPAKAVVPAGPPAPTPDAQQLIDSMWVAVQEEAASYRSIYGEEPPASWWNARTAPIEATQKRLDASSKGGGSATVKAETERIRNIQGGREGEKFLRQQAVARKEEMLKRVAELYDPQQTKNATDLATVLKSASDAFDLAEKQVGAAQADFTKNFKPSTAYEGIPIATYNVADNPLIAALQQQGAGTEQVQAATDYARQFAQQTSGLEKWAAGQLGAGQKNFESAAQNAAQMGTMAALEGLGARRADVKTGINQQFADALAQIGQSKTEALGNVDTTIADIIAKADAMRAETSAKYGKLPSETKKKTGNKTTKVGVTGK